MKHLIELSLAVALVVTVCFIRHGPENGAGAADSAPLSAKAKSTDKLPFPAGKRFPLGLYGLATRSPEEMVKVSASGWNLGQNYRKDQEEFQKIMTPSGLSTLARLSDRTEEAAGRTIKALSLYDCVSWWDLPEERPFWKPEEFALIKNLCRWTRKHDPKKRPNYMYIPCHYNAADVARYVPYLDIIGAGTYTEFAHMPRAWVRYRVEANIEAIRLAGCKVGPDYLRGEKTPIGIPMLFAAQPTAKKKFGVISPAGAYHDFYSCLAAGARGILLFSYGHRDDPPGLQKSYEAYARAAAEVAGPEGLGEALLFGKQVRVRVEITKGPRKTSAFVASKKNISYPSINVRAVQWGGKLYIVAVNSSEKKEPVQARLKGLPGSPKEARVPFESRTLSISAGALADTFESLGVHVYVVAL